MTAEKITPYVVSADVNLLMQEWSKDSGYIVPPLSSFRSYSNELEQFLREVFKTQVDMVSEDELKDGINELSFNSKYPLISMDRIYLDGQMPNLEKYLDVTRAVGEDFKDLLEKLYPRCGCLAIKEQLDALAKDKKEPVTLVDDVLFSGGGFMWLAEELVKRNRPIKQAVFGIGIGEGLDKVRGLGIEVQCVREYPEVIDEICERDFLACIPFSGRTLICSEGNYWGAPYFLPFGNPEKWASIPSEATEEYSKFCLSKSIRLWGEIEALSNTKIPTDKAPRRIIGLRPNQSITEALEEYYPMIRHADSGML
ncbi:MAG: hypothetical protein V1808_01600 [Candidatus Daviesbacteria bacterium]